MYAACHTPVDLNNLFITAPDPTKLVSKAEHDGYPRNACGWIKGLYATALKSGIDALIAVVEGDCSQTHAMVETLSMSGLETIPFSFPYGRDKEMLAVEIKRLADRLGANKKDIAAWKARLDSTRQKVHVLDETCWKEGKVTSLEDHLFQVNTSDFSGNPDAFSAEVDQKLAEVESRRPENDRLRLGFIGVPPIFLDFYEYIESLGARIFFNEVQRQFSMPHATDDIVEQYALYTYPYDVFARVEDIKSEIEKRNLRGIIHYTQSFCFRQIEDIIIRKELDVPVLTLEGDSPAPLDERTKIRIESFIEMLG